MKLYFFQAEVVSNDFSTENSIEKIEESNVTDIHDEPHSDEVESENNSTVRTDLNDLDPKIRKGMERIKKLDNILNEKVQVIKQCRFLHIV